MNEWQWNIRSVFSSRGLRANSSQAGIFVLRYVEVSFLFAGSQQEALSSAQHGSFLHATCIWAIQASPRAACRKQASVSLPWLPLGRKHCLPTLHPLTSPQAVLHFANADGLCLLRKNSGSWLYLRSPPDSNRVSYRVVQLSQQRVGEGGRECMHSDLFS